VKIEDVNMTNLRNLVEKVTLIQVQLVVLGEMTSKLVFPGPVWSGFFAIFGWTATATSCLYIESVKKPDWTDAKPQKTGSLNQSQPGFEKTGLTIGCDP
jgi:hypothetical protein